MKLRLQSLRSRLFILVLVGVLPAFALAVYTDLERRRATVATAHEEALRIARIAASEQNDVFQGARQLIFTLAQLPAVKTLDANACRPLLADLFSRSPGYVNIAIVAPTGDVVCSALPNAGSTSVRDREYFQRALATHDFSMSGYLIGRITGKATVAADHGEPLDLFQAGQAGADADRSW